MKRKVHIKDSSHANSKLKSERSSSANQKNQQSKKRELSRSKKRSPTPFKRQSTQGSPKRVSDQQRLEKARADKRFEEDKVRQLD